MYALGQSASPVDLVVLLQAGVMVKNSEAVKEAITHMDEIGFKADGDLYRMAAEMCLSVGDIDAASLVVQQMEKVGCAPSDRLVRRVETKTPSTYQSLTLSGIS